MGFPIHRTRLIFLEYYGMTLEEKEVLGVALKHVHEFEGSTQVVEGHNHRFAGVTGPAILTTNSHVHQIFTRTDFYEDHFHRLDRLSGPARDVGGGRHVHFTPNGLVTTADGHRHPYRVATLIDDPIGD